VTEQAAEPVPCTAAGWYCAERWQIDLTGGEHEIGTFPNRSYLVSAIAFWPVVVSLGLRVVGLISVWRGTRAYMALVRARAGR
jgi:hypothetical protein